MEAELNAKGDLASEFTLEPSEVLYGQIDVESAVRDDRGKYVANTASAAFVGRDRYVGLAQSDWVLKAGEPAKVQAIVVDEQGKVAPGTEIKVLVEYSKTVASRVKGAGNAYLTHFEEVWEKVSDMHPRFGAGRGGVRLYAGAPRPPPHHGNHRGYQG